jgi:uncharacterized ion transporter superfamily protein YfcC
VTRAIAVTLVLLALIVAAFVATWVTIPGGRYEQKNLTRGYWETDRVVFPAKLFRFGLAERVVEACTDTPEDPFGRFACSYMVLRRVDLHTLRERVVVSYAGLAAVVVLIGLAIGALRRPSRPPSAEST